MTDPRLPVCTRLRSRGFYQAAPDELAHFAFAPEHSCWCAQTVTVLGPDDLLCSVATCQPGRACFAER